jgi:glycerol transport system ATP-binding protein
VARIDLENVAHTYEPGPPDPTYALNRFSITWDDGGRYAVLGPSGCGKTTMLNIMSGIISPSEGRIRFDGVDVTDQSTSTRNVAQVFQFPVIYTTMSVKDNLAFPLVCRNVAPDTIRRKVQEVAEVLNLEDLLGRSARRLTADQKQLISLGRGLVREEVAAVLMDEPLTVVDPDLKFRLRRKLKETNERYGTTLIYVTHDQNEAMTFAQNIVVMDQGRIVQQGTPEELFERPQTTFVGYFIGSPAMNLFDCEVASDHEVAIADHKFRAEASLGNVRSKNLKLGIRPERVAIASPGSLNSFQTTIERVEDFGNYKVVTARIQDMSVKIKTKREAELPASETWLQFPPENCCIYEDGQLVRRQRL